jgi:guanine nucleotide-binding protein subunit alpha
MEMRNSGAYQRAVRSMFTRAIHGRRRTDTESIDSQPVDGRVISKKEKARSKNIDVLLKHDKIKRRNECRILMLGRPESGKEAILNQMKATQQDGYSTSELEWYRDRILTRVVDAMHILLRYAQDSGLKLGDDIDRNHAEIVSRQCAIFPEIIPELPVAIENLWKSPNIPLQKIVNENVGLPPMADWVP